MRKYGIQSVENDMEQNAKKSFSDNEEKLTIAPSYLCYGNRFIAYFRLRKHNIPSFWAQLWLIDVRYFKSII